MIRLAWLFALAALAEAWCQGGTAQPVDPQRPYCKYGIQHPVGVTHEPTP